MSNKPNVFERRRDLLALQIGKRRDALYNASGVGERPYGTRQLNGQERIQYFASQPEARKYELWGQMDESERDEIRQGLSEQGRQQGGQ